MARGAPARGRRRIPGRRPAPAALGRIPPAAHRDRVLGGPAEPPPRPRPVHPRGRGLDRPAALAVTSQPERVTGALDAIRAGDAATLARLLDSDPGLVHVEVGAGGSLLGEVAQPDVFGTSLRHALGVDRACVEVLIERGSELDGPLNLAACFDRVELVQLLRDAGARVDAVGIYGVTPLETAIYHAARAAVDVLAAIELVPDAPWVAAGAGHVARLERFLDGRGGLTDDAHLHRPNPADVGWL